MAKSISLAGATHNQAITSHANCRPGGSASLAHTKQFVLPLFASFTQLADAPQLQGPQQGARRDSASQCRRHLPEGRRAAANPPPRARVRPPKYTRSHTRACAVTGTRTQSCVHICTRTHTESCHTDKDAGPTLATVTGTVTVSHHRGHAVTAAHSVTVAHHSQSRTQTESHFDTSDRAQAYTHTQIVTVTKLGDLPAN
jgi:hypothetical protein